VTLRFGVGVPVYLVTKALEKCLNCQLIDPLKVMPL
jgi:hypothetical protein